MTDAAARYTRIHEILTGARGLEGERLEIHLTEACAGDETLRASVLELLLAGSDPDADDAFTDPSLAVARDALEGLVQDATSGWLPERIGEYAILRQIGQGGMGIVYEAEQESPRRRVALKLLHPVHATGRRLRRFQQEAELLGRLQHQGIAQIFEAGTYDVGRGPQPYFAMELVDGVDIRTHCERRTLDRGARIALLAEVADAVEYAHERGVIHRDLKPDNVLVDDRGHPRILDFGIARAQGDGTPLSTLLTEEGQIVGTLAYMAPEQLGRSDEALAPRLDVYSLGVLAFELLVGHLPRAIDDLSIAEAIGFLAHSEAPRAGILDASLRGDVETILGKALESDPTRRYATPAAFAADLRRHLDDQPIAARPPSGVYLARKFARRNKALVGGVIATLVVAILGAAVATHYALAASRRADALERASYIAGVAAASSAIAEQDFAMATEFLDRLPTARRGWEYDYLRARLVQHADAWELPAPLVTAPVFDPAGERWVGLLADATLASWDASSGRLRERSSLAEALTSDSLGPRSAALEAGTRSFAAFSASGELVRGGWGSGGRPLLDTEPDGSTPTLCDCRPDGRILYHVNRTTYLWDGAEARVLHTPGSAAAAFDHAGDRVAVGGARIGDLLLLDPATGERIAERKLDDNILDLEFSPDDGWLAVAGLYKTVFLLDGRTLETVAHLTGHRGAVYDVAWNADGSRLASTSEDGSVRVWSLTELGSSTVHSTGLRGWATVAFAPDGADLVVAGERMLRFPIEDPYVLRGHASFVYSLAFSPDGSMLASADFQQRRFCLWDVRTARLLRQVSQDLPHSGDPCYWAPAVAFSDDGRRLVAATTWATGHWDVQTGEALAGVESSDPAERFFETLGRAQDPKLLNDYSARSPDGRTLGIARGTGTIELYEVPADSDGGAIRAEGDLPYARLEGHVGGALCVAFTPDGTRIATGGHDATIRLWDARTLEPLLLLRGHGMYVAALAFSPDGTLLASASGDTTIRLWDTKTLQDRRSGE